MGHLFRKINRYFLPAKEGIDEAKYNLLISFTWLTGIFSLFYVWVSRTISYHPGVYIMLVNFVIFLATLFLIKYKLSYRAAGNLYLANCLFIAILGCTWFSGGLYSPVIPWFTLVPVTSLLLLGTGRNTVFWLLATSLCVLLFLLVAQSDTIILKRNYDDSYANFFFYTCFGGLVLILYVVTQVFENIKNKALDEVSEKNKELQSAISQLRSAQEQLVQQEKLASLGQLTAGIAHEIKNPLNFVNNFSQLSMDLLDDLKRETDEQYKDAIYQDLTSNLTKIKHHGNRADFIIKSMLQYSRIGSADFQATDINKLCDEYANLAYHGLRASEKTFYCHLEKAFTENIPPVYCVTQDISRVILNVLNNAMYAVKNSENPTVIIKTSFDTKNAYVEVKDNGMGMSTETVKKIFEPFYTTKPAGQGTGLGLSISLEIIKAHGGRMEVHSDLGKGTTFIIVLPISKKR